MTVAAVKLGGGAFDLELFEVCACVDACVCASHLKINKVFVTRPNVVDLHGHSHGGRCGQRARGEQELPDMLWSRHGTQRLSVCLCEVSHVLGQKQSRCETEY